MEINKSITAIVKVTDKCNLRCPYCYEAPNAYTKTMDMKIFKKLVLELATNYDSAEIIFHGGEPTLNSYDWYNEALEYINRHGVINNCEFKLSLQSNIYNVDERLAILLRDNNVPIGSSFDGLSHDKTRYSTTRYLKNINRLSELYLKNRREGIGSIMVVTSDNSHELIANLHYFDSIGLDTMMLNLVYETKSTHHNLEDMTIPKNYIKAYEYYLTNETLKVDIRQFLDYFKMTLILDGHKVNRSFLCNSCHNCIGKWIGVSTNGDITPCGGGWGNECIIGNIVDDSIVDILLSDKLYNIAKSQMQYSMKCKKDCKLYNVCFGGCVERNNFIDFDHSKNIQCIAMKGIINLTKDYLVNKRGDIRNINMLKILEEYNI